MKDHRSEGAIRAELEHALAAREGVDLVGNVRLRIEGEAAKLIRAVDYAPPKGHDGEIGALLSEHHAAFQHRLAERNAIAAASRARVEAELAERDAPNRPPAGFAFVNVRDAIDGKLYRLTLPAEHVKRLGT